MDIPRLLHLCSLKIAFDFRGDEVYMHYEPL